MEPFFTVHTPHQTHRQARMSHDVGLHDIRCSYRAKKSCILRLSRLCAQDFEAHMAQGLPLVPPADHVVVPRAVYDRLRHAWNDRVLEASVGL